MKTEFKIVGVVQEVQTDKENRNAVITVMIDANNESIANVHIYDKKVIQALQDHDCTNAIVNASGRIRTVGIDKICEGSLKNITDTLLYEFVADELELLKLKMN